MPLTLPRHRHDLSRGEVRASQQLRVLDATAEAVAELGYADATVEAITRRAGVSRRTFYELFPSKEEAVLAAYAAIDVVIARMRAAAAEHSEPRAMLRAGLRTYLQSLAAEPAFTRMLVLEATGAGPRILAQRAAAFEDFVEAISAPLELAHEADPRLPEPDRGILLVLLGGINELCLQHLTAHGAATLPELAPTIDRAIERLCFPLQEAG